MYQTDTENIEIGKDVFHYQEHCFKRWNTLEHFIQKNSLNDTTKIAADTTKTPTNNTGQGFHFKNFQKIHALA